MTTIVNIEELGRRIRKLRVERRMTLKQVEQVSGLSATHLSEIERGRTSPTIGALVRIARALQKDASFFIEAEERSDVAHLTGDSLRKIAMPSGITAEALTEGVPGSLVYAYRLTLASGSELKLPARELSGDAVYYVKRGSVDAAFGAETATLANGDAAQAATTLDHVLRCRAGEAECIALMTRPLEERLTPATESARP